MSITIIDWNLWVFYQYHHHRLVSMGHLEYHHYIFVSLASYEYPTTLADNHSHSLSISPSFFFFLYFYSYPPPLAMYLGILTTTASHQSWVIIFPSPLSYPSFPLSPIFLSLSPSCTDIPAPIFDQSTINSSSPPSTLSCVCFFFHSIFY